MADPQELRSTPLSSQLPSPTTYLTGYDEVGKSILESTRPNQWKPFENNEMAFSQVYTTSFPADLNANKDIAFHDEVMASGTLGLVKKDGVVCRMVSIKSESQLRSSPLSFIVVRLPSNVGGRSISHRVTPVSSTGLPRSILES